MFKVFQSWDNISPCFVLTRLAFCRYKLLVSLFLIFVCFVFVLLFLFLFFFFFVQWKFAFLSLGRPEYLQDSDIVSSRFQVSLSHMCSCAHTPAQPHTCLSAIFHGHWHDNFSDNFLLFHFLFDQRRDVYGAWEQYLGLEHSDNAPKRSYAANQVCAVIKLIGKVIGQAKKMIFDNWIINGR
jgi:hypothetical protein